MWVAERKDVLSGLFWMANGLVAVPAASLPDRLAGAALVLLRRAPFLAAGWRWSLVSLLPVIGLGQIGFQATADRYTYLPSIGLLLVLAGGIRRFEKTRPAVGSAAAWVCAAA